VLRTELEWAEVVVLVGEAVSLEGSGRLGRRPPPLVLDDGLGPRAVARAPEISPAERTAARAQLGVGDRTAWLLAHDPRDRRRARSVALELPGALRLDHDRPETRELVVAAADVVVSPVPVDAVPLDLLVAAGRGVPAVAVDSPALRPFVDERTGALVPDDPVALARAVSSVGGGSRRVELGRGAAARVRSEADPEDWSGAWLQRCRSALP